jgi:putative transposase
MDRLRGRPRAQPELTRPTASVRSNTAGSTRSGDRPAPAGRREGRLITDPPSPSQGNRSYRLVLDVFSRPVAGWSIEAAPTAILVTNALGRAIGQRSPTGGTVIHSDQGTQFTAWAFTQRANDSGLVPSMGSIGDCFDNAVIESFWSRMQVELLDRARWRTRLELAYAIFE